MLLFICLVAVLFYFLLLLLYAIHWDGLFTKVIQHLMLFLNFRNQKQRGFFVLMLWQEVWLCIYFSVHFQNFLDNSW